MISALFVAKNGCYYGLENVDPWDEERDARLYAGPWPVVAHPPCNLWVNFAALNFSRYGGEHNRPGNDGGCFASALASVRRWGGVMEHPAKTNAWAAHGIPRPTRIGWQSVGPREWVCEVWQSAYGHKANKATWLFYCGSAPPPSMQWERPAGTHQIGFHDKRGKDKNKPTVSGKAASATPLAFRDLLISIAESVNIDKQCGPL